MGQGDKRKKKDRVIVSISSSKGGIGGGSQKDSQQECPLSFQTKLGKEYRKYAGSKVVAKIEKGVVIIVGYDNQKVAEIKGQRGIQIARCMQNNHYKYEGTVALDKDDVYARLQIA